MSRMITGYRIDILDTGVVAFVHFFRAPSERLELPRDKQRFDELVAEYEAGPPEDKAMG